MFDPQDSPRLFGLPPGVDYSAELLAGLRTRLETQPPEAMARVTLIVNTRKMAKRLRQLCDSGPDMMLPRICTLASLESVWPLPGLPDAMPPLRRKLELARLISALIDRAPDLAPRSALFDLADSLAGLMDEMHGEGVGMDAIDALDIADQSGHWARLKSFLAITRDFDDRDDCPGAEARNRLVTEALLARWQAAPPQGPVILAGSTGSRGTTQMLMQAVAALPQGAVVLPGFDYDMSDSAWNALEDRLGGEDHPQYRFRALLDQLGLAPTALPRWTETAPACPPRNAVLSMALRPAPVTDQWRSEGPLLTEIPEAMQGVTLLEAPSRRTEALAIAMRLREAAEAGTPAALITPDRDLTRQVTAALDRWRILPDDSAGTPLHRTAQGRFLRHVAALMTERLSTELLLTLLKHPLTHAGSERGAHLRLARELELHLRRKGLPFPDHDAIATWCAAKPEERQSWCDWLGDTFLAGDLPGSHPLPALAAHHRALARRIAWGSTPGADWPPSWSDPLLTPAGPQSLAVLDELALHGPHGGPASAVDFGNLLQNLLSSGEVRSAERADPLIRIWGTIEARVQGAELIILAGLNEGSWPETPGHDPWLNRALRKQAGLLLPERRIGLAAHDFQQAALGPEVWITRAVRNDEAETVVSRWLNRLQNLLSGLPDQGGVAALDGMRARGKAWLDRVDQLEAVTPTAPEPRPAPCPPRAARPSRLSVTAIKRLIRDPYAIYARHVLGLSALNPVQRVPDALMRGNALHDVLERFIIETRDDDSTVTVARLMRIADEELAAQVPWAQTRMQWRARLERVADGFVADELARRTVARPAALEIATRGTLPALSFTLTAKADRLDVTPDGKVMIYDYKTGTPPSAKEQEFFDRQLLLEAALTENFGWENFGAAPVLRAAYIGLGAKAGELDAPLEDLSPADTWAQLAELIGAYMQPDKGFVSRRALQKAEDVGDYDQLARYGEWTLADDPVPIALELPDG
jgi:double-strand break repair protein AddB